jgi:hypothetical protein
LLSPARAWVATLPSHGSGTVIGVQFLCPASQYVHYAGYASLLTAHTLYDSEHLRGAATHHLLLIRTRQGTKQPVYVLLGFEPDGPNMREV